ncbi:MAG: TonB-dependent receptor plug domain-containing protein, partial [bacterium]
SNTYGPIGLRLSVSRHYSTSDRENGDFSRWYVTARPVINFDDGSNLSIFMAYSRDARGFFFQWQDQNHALSTDFDDRLDVDGFFISATYNKLYTANFAVKSRLSFNSQLIGLPFNLTRDFKPALGFSGEIQANWLPNANHNLTFGIDAKRDLAESTFFGEHQGTAASPYIQETWKVNKNLQLSAGLGYEAYFLIGDSAETQISPKIGFSFKPFPGTILHASVGRGFRAPTIAERFSVTDPDDNVQLVNNPTLLPERSTLFDIGIRQHIGNFFSAEVTAFTNTYTDLIELAQISDLTIELQFRNCLRARIEGIETEARLQFWRNRLGVQVNATWMESRSLEADRLCNLDEDAALPYRPKFSAYFSPYVKFGSLTLEAEYRYMSRFESVSFFPRDERVPLKLLDLRARYRWKRYTLLFQVKNAVNYNYTVVEQNLGELRNFSLAISGEL